MNTYGKRKIVASDNKTHGDKQPGTRV